MLDSQILKPHCNKEGIKFTRSQFSYSLTSVRYAAAGKPIKLAGQWVVRKPLLQWKCQRQFLVVTRRGNHCIII